MGVVRKTVYRAKANKVEALRDFLQPLVPVMTTLPGNEGCLLIQSREDPTEFMMLEFWDSVESHAATVKNIPPAMIAQALLLLAGMPTGVYYDALEDKRKG